MIDVLDPAIASQIPAGALDNGKIYRGTISVTGGQVLGRIGGKTLDFANVDTNTFLPRLHSSCKLPSRALEGVHGGHLRRL